jgi:hypothetical protein
MKDLRGELPGFGEAGLPSPAESMGLGGTGV